MMLVFWVEFRFEPPWWLHVLILWVPFTFAAAVWLLRLLKALADRPAVHPPLDRARRNDVQAAADFLAHR